MMAQLLTHQALRKSPTDSPDRDLLVNGTWDADALKTLINARSEHERRPTHLFLGRHEAKLLKEYLVENDLSYSGGSLEDFDYEGLQIEEVDSDSLLRVAGERYMGHLSRTGRHREPIEQSNSWWRTSPSEA